MNIDINKLVRQNILNLSPYSSARDEFSGTEGIFLEIGRASCRERV